MKNSEERRKTGKCEKIEHIRGKITIYTETTNGMKENGSYKWNGGRKVGKGEKMKRRKVGKCEKIERRKKGKDSA